MVSHLLKGTVLNNYCFIKQPCFAWDWIFMEEVQLRLKETEEGYFLWSSDPEHHLRRLRLDAQTSPPVPSLHTLSLTADCGIHTQTFSLWLRLSLLVSCPPYSPAQALPSQWISLWLFSFPERNLRPHLQADACSVILPLSHWVS